MKLYLDTCVISAITKNDIKESDLSALTKILGYKLSQTLEVVTSQVAKEEIEKIPEEYREKHLKEYEALVSIPTLDYLRIDFFSRTGLRVKQTIEFGKLFMLLKDINDARHIYQAFRNEIKYFIIVDYKTILKHKNDIESICNVKTLSPVEFIESVEIKYA